MLSVIGIICVVYIAWRIINELGKSLPILELMLFIAGLQWIVGPTIEYNMPGLHYRYYMYVPEPDYMKYVVPAYILFTLVIVLGLRKFKTAKLPINVLSQFSDYGLIIFGIGVFFDLIHGFLPGGLMFFGFIVSNFKFAGAIILFFSPKKIHKRIFYFSIAYLFIISLGRAMFHDFILWSVFFYMFWALKHKPKIKVILLTFLIGGFFLVSLQTIKAAYRDQIWNGYAGNKVELFVGLMLDTVLNNNSLDAPATKEDTNVRLNQGWIISAVMNNIPINQPYFEGSTVSEAIYASILPRFLNPNKKEAGGQENFMRFTGLHLGAGTSMGISIIGEGYGNYGATGGIWFMGIWGLFLVVSWNYLYKYCLKNMLFIAFLPLIFLQVIKAETELVVVLNHFVKSSIVVFLFFLVCKRMLNWRMTYA